MGQAESGAKNDPAGATAGANVAVKAELPPADASALKTSASEAVPEAQPLPAAKAQPSLAEGPGRPAVQPATQLASAAAVEAVASPPSAKASDGGRPLASQEVTGAKAEPAAASLAALKAARKQPKAQPKVGAATGSQDKGKGKGKEEKGTRLCIKNLGEDMTQVQLRTLFEPFGTILSVHVKTKEDGKCRGFAFISLSHLDEASSAIAEMNRKDIGGKPLSVALAEERSVSEGAELGRIKGKGKGRSQDKGADHGGGKGKVRSKSGAASSAPAQQLGHGAAYAYGCAQQMQMTGMSHQMYGYPGYPYQQMPPPNQSTQQQMQALQMAQMQSLCQGMYLQSLQSQAAQSSQGSAPRASDPMAGARLHAQVAGPVGKEHVGVLKSLSARNGYGFIECEETRRSSITEKDRNGRDVYVSADILPDGGKEPGARLRFRAGQNSKGHPQARSCALFV